MLTCSNRLIPWIIVVTNANDGKGNEGPACDCWFDVHYRICAGDYMSNELLIKNEKRIILGAAYGSAIGLAIGTVIGAIVDEVGIWISMGISFGAGVGVPVAILTNADDLDK